MREFRFSKFAYIFLLILTTGLWSCKTTREVASVNIKPISTQKLLKSIENTGLNYEYLTIGRINCQYSGNQSNATFRVNIKAVKDQKILASVTKLNIPVVRVLLTPDSVVYVNFIEKNYFTDDYTFLSNYLNIDLDFELMQSVISNSAFSYRNDEKDKDFRAFNTSVEEGMYVLQSQRERKMIRLETKNKASKIERRLKRFDDTALILQKLFFNPENFALSKVVISDKTNGREMLMNFGDFVKINDKDYPGSIDMLFLSEDEKLELNVRMSGFSTEKQEPFQLEIPQNYKRVSIN
jgi:hypothetical protein